MLYVMFKSNEFWEIQLRLFAAEMYEILLSVWNM